MSNVPITNTVTIISDPEGFDLMSQSNFQSKPSNMLYVCGDILDSSQSLSPATISGDLLYKLKSNNLKNIYQCIVNPKIRLLFGNRDLNKIKCKFLCQLDNDRQLSSYFISNFNDGEIDLKNMKVYKELVTELHSRSKLQKEIWKVQSMKNWYPFWNTSRFNAALKQKWATKSDYSVYPFKVRFDEIFGADPTIGTMSASNLLRSIPVELGIDISITTPEYDDYLAFVVLAVFRSMCLSNQPIGLTHGEKDIINIRNTKQVRGWLHSLYKLHKSCEVLHYRDRNGKPVYYLLSHGGITYDLINNPESLYNIKKKFIDRTDNKVVKYMSNVEEYNKMTGGFYTTTTRPSVITDLNETIGNLNYTIKLAIDDVLKIDDMSIPTNEMLFLLVLTTNFNCSLFSSTIKDAISCKNLAPSNTLGPITPGITQMRENSWTLKDAFLCQIIGHVPSGFGMTVDLFESLPKSGKVDKALLINLDVSNTFHNMINNKIDKDHNISKTIIIINPDSSFIVHSVINIDTTKLVPQIYNNHHYGDIDILGADRYIISGGFDTTQPIVINNYLNIIDDMIRYTGNNPKITTYFHGYTEQSGNYYYIFTYQDSSAFVRTLMVLNKTDFINFFRLTIAPTILPPIIIGGSNYYNLYKKYKTKYLKLKNDHNI